MSLVEFGELELDLHEARQGRYSRSFQCGQEALKEPCYLQMVGPRMGNPNPSFVVTLLQNSDQPGLHGSAGRLLP
jgi:hypothetical protein